MHIVNKSPFQSDCLNSCLRIISPEDALLLIEDGVYAALDTPRGLASLAPAIPVYALEADCRARGILDQLHASVKPTDDHGFVELTLAYAKSQSWF
nr:sulfurtransferase complex subunit TusB [Motiliproteus sp. SC1-56]